MFKIPRFKPKMYIQFEESAKSLDHFDSAVDVREEKDLRIPVSTAQFFFHFTFHFKFPVSARLTYVPKYVPLSK